MAAKYRKIDPRIWGDEKFARLDGKGKLLALYCLTCPQGNRIGLFRFSPALAAEDLDTVCDTLVKTLDTVCDTMKWRFDQGARVLYFPTWWKYNHPDNSKHFAGCLDDLHDVPETRLIVEFAANIEYLESGYHEQFRNGIAYRMRNGMAYQEQEQEQNQNQEQEQEIPPSPQGGNAGTEANGRRPRKGKAVYRVEDQAYPPDLDTDEFRAAWHDWTLHRLEKRAAMTPLVAGKCLAKCRELGSARAIAAINHSIANGWQGLFEPTQNGKPIAPRSTIGY